MQNPTSVKFVHKQVVRKERNEEEYREFLEKKSFFSIKRVFDILLSSLIVLFVLSWLTPIIALIIKIDSRGPVFFKQKRIGLNGRIFDCLKFRSMYLNSEADKTQCANNDPRITRTGKFLRISCLDELPQFFNVLLGDMTLVGPRPHMISDCEKFLKAVGNYNARHIVKPGITGIAQVKGYRGMTNDFLDIYHRYQWDMFYIRNACFKLDLLIIHKTLIQALKAIGILIKPKTRSENRVQNVFFWKN